MEKIYNLVKCWYDREVIDNQEWQEFCVAILEMIMKENKYI